jgi:hypothetical protein
MGKRPSEIMRFLNKSFCNTNCALVYRNKHLPIELKVSRGIKSYETRKRRIECGELQPQPKHTDESKRKLSIKRRETAQKPEHIAKVKALPIHTPGTPEYIAKCEKISKTRIERHIMPSVDQVEAWRKRMKQWISENGGARKGKKLNEEQRKHLSLVHIGLQAGDKHPNWQGGISKHKYGNGWSRTRRRLVRERDHDICQFCFINLTDTKTRSSIHHIDYDKQNSNFNNLILLCHKCNCRVNFNRDYWTAHFQSIMRTKEMIKANSALPCNGLKKKS